jgi:colanic acid/amylovoran biosynthesis glycosyltransferase
MPTTCIIRGHQPLISETFLDAHVDRLSGEKVVLYNYFPEYTFNGRALRYFYCRRPWLRKAQRLLPVFLYDKLITAHQQSDARTLDFMAGFFQSHNVNVILAEYGFNGADITPIAKALGIPLVVHFHGHDAHREPELIPYRERYQRMFEYAESLISVSHFMTETLIEMGADPAKIAYNPYGAREYFYEVQPDYNSKTLVTLGRFADIKAPYLALMAFRKAFSAVPDARLIMIGDGPLLEACRSLAKTWGMEKAVTFTGALTHGAALPFLNRACGFVQHSVTTSYGDAEGMPNSILEAGAAGLPVVSTRHAGIATAVLEGQTGFLVDERDVDGMADRMGQLLQGPQLCQTQGQAARRHIRENYSIDQHIDRLQNLIDAARCKGQASRNNT